MLQPNLQHQVLSVNQPHVSENCYIATLRLLPITESNETYAEWSATFNCKPEDEEFLLNLIGQGVFKKGFDSLKSIFA